ncbi:methyl-accepting chemotaxis protein [Clostridium felsineum]|uniref:Methyl-accepting chemotaxis protein McpB n=1 Tax=Clostridium felsineum TaxID=36839 RepID=A0A1S8LN03_9CLOT|nr:methyl-accepting chemotaxis protein [Clostridium felsineum]URZ06529.1 Methyl-accepting chemotaxis protein McpB [Clostridium felsineum]URZ11564.1 Methyl-accepting chemotaxis protein McpB [Clostridium felsineum]
MNFTLMKKIKKERKISIAYKIALIVGILIISIMMIADGIIYYETYTNIYGINKSNMKVVSSEIYNNFKTLVLLQSNEVKNLSNDSDLKNIAVNPKDASEIEHFKNKINTEEKNNEEVENVFFAGKDGITLIASNSDYFGYDNSHFDYIKKALNGQASMSSVYISVMTSKPVITFVSPVKDQNGTVLGVAGKTIYIDYFSKRFDKFKYMGNGYIFIVDSNNKVVYHPQKYYINKENTISEIKKVEGKKNFFNKEDYETINYSFNDTRYFASVVSIPDMKLVFVLTSTENSFQSIPKQTGYIIVIITLLSILITIPILVFIIKLIFKPMKKLMRDTQEISKGNLRVKNCINRGDEVGILSKSFYSMVSNVSGLLERVKRVSKELIDINLVVKASYDNTNSNMEVINNSMQLSSKNSTKIFYDLENWFETYENISLRVENIRKSSGKMSDLSKDIKEFNTIGIESIKSLISINEFFRQSIKEVNITFKELQDNTANIKDIINLVKGISNSTKMLALNASIEASRLGEAGKGFDVVASNIKKLSYNVETQITGIDSIASKINNKISDMQGKMDSLNDEYKEQIEAIKTAKENYTNVFSMVEEINNNIKTIDENANYVSLKNQNVYDEFKNISEFYNEFNKSIEEIRIIMNKQYNSTKNINSMISKMDVASMELKENMSKFNL